MEDAVERKKIQFKIQLDRFHWLAPGEGLSTTPLEERAQSFSLVEAFEALERVRKIKPFKQAKIKDDF